MRAFAGFEVGKGAVWCDVDGKRKKK